MHDKIYRIISKLSHVWQTFNNDPFSTLWIVIMYFVSRFINKALYYRHTARSIFFPSFFNWTEAEPLSALSSDKREYRIGYFRVTPCFCAKTVVFERNHSYENLFQLHVHRFHANQSHFLMKRFSGTRKCCILPLQRHSVWQLLVVPVYDFRLKYLFSRD